MRSRAVIAGLVGILIVAIAIGAFVALRSNDDEASTKGAKSVPLADLSQRDALIAISDTNVGQVTKIRNALDASPNVVAYTEVRPGVANEINTPGLSGGPAQCQASGFILDLAPSVDPNEFASTLPKGADVLAWKTVTSGSSYDPQNFDRLVAGPYVLVMLAPDCDAETDRHDQDRADGRHARRADRRGVPRHVPGRPTRHRPPPAPARARPPAEGRGAGQPGE